MGDLSLPSNYCGTSLSSIFTKGISRLILNRIQSKVDQYLRPKQNLPFEESLQ